MWTFYLIFSLLLTLCYAAIMWTYRRGWHLLEKWELPAGFDPRTRVSVLIPARNEAENIAACLHSILNGSYPAHLLEIWVIDDHSEDATATIVQAIAHKSTASVRLLPLAEHLKAGEIVHSHKKKAIETAIRFCSGSLIVTTDADCVAAPDWLRLIVSAFETLQPKMIAAPVAFHRNRNLLQHFQTLDFAGMMGITGAGIRLGFQRMGNGANLSYTKAVFEEVNGFEGVDGLASGDDMFLLQKVAHRYPNGIFFLKNAEATIQTEAKEDWRSFLQQRIRWGSKNAAYPEKWVTVVLAAVFFFCWTIVLNLFLAPFSYGVAYLLAVQLIVKVGFDWLFLSELSRFFGKQQVLRWFLPSFFLHIAYIAFVGLASQFVKKYEWKGRRVR